MAFYSVCLWRTKFRVADERWLLMIIRVSFYGKEPWLHGRRYRWYAGFRFEVGMVSHYKVAAGAIYDQKIGEAVLFSP